MHIIPELPGCGQSATIRIEICSRADGSPDGSVHACQAHVAAIESAITAAGLTPYRTAGDGGGMRCGDGFDLTRPGAWPIGPGGPPVRRIIPDLPGCGQPGMQMIEVYRPTGADAYASLVGHGYACREHLTDLIAAVIRTGLTPLHIPAGPLAARPCGSAYEFDTASLPDRPQVTHQIPVPGIPPVEVPLTLAGAPDGPEHPQWCTRAAICRMEGIHCSAPYPVALPGVAVQLRLWLEQPATAPALPVVLFEFTDERSVEYLLTVEQTRLLIEQARLVLALVGER
ncbi:hypothetical protein [Micromonospora zhanjiangensis]|uniref:DUF2470 domain-containing protein n=1 Tax=Micromonospora zhanjiangensis TaxID=1522057 RepID=A0ABV8KLF5_9ACTN